jgi:hypothetical protein
VYLDDSLYLVGIYNEYTSNFGFKCVRVNGINAACVDTLTKFSVIPQLDDTLTCEATKDTCGFVEVNMSHGVPTIYDTLECTQEESLLLLINELAPENDLWDLLQVTSSGIDVVLLSDHSTKYYVNIYNILGKLVYKNEFDAIKGITPVKMKFNVKPSVYLIKVSDGVNSQSQKVINYHLN